MNIIRNRDRKIKKEKYIKDQEEMLEEELIPFTQIDSKLLLCCGILIISIIASFIVAKWELFIYSVICTFLTIYIGRRLKFKENNDEVTNVVIGNLSQSINDFIEYKIKNYDLLGDYKNLLLKTSIVLTICLLFVVNSAICLIPTLFFILLFFISFANKNFCEIRKCIKWLIVTGFFGFVLKMIFAIIVTNNLSIDLFNIININIFTIIQLIIDNIEIKEP
ncbi:MULTISPECIES: hypothetical protein [unclassified Clostridioides]|uniref:hypothetical protein n=1 Tax=unclassified Clostridioides TaxID=2635829 RepID=UPI001D0FC71D|nr:hypothetical protein [Clostridioides sp. ES-S-0145-01]MCC0682255.1 hypothetical protein [Clostridioides sp. ES-S-0005-03]MCC0705516.1 hypothetical protein [Clostridioides sp. ES-S-0190-01]UDN63922.1 hypothetical protein IC758_20135 [Clostridioides sp. ES-W-0016-02]